MSERQFRKPTDKDMRQYGEASKLKFKKEKKNAKH